MDLEIKQELHAINNKLDTYIAHQREILDLELNPIKEHIKEGHHFRDNIVRIGERVRINRALIMLIVGSITTGAIGGIIWILRMMAK